MGVLYKKSISIQAFVMCSKYFNFQVRIELQRKIKTLYESIQKSKSQGFCEQGMAGKAYFIVRSEDESMVFAILEDFFSTHGSIFKQDPCESDSISNVVYQRPVIDRSWIDWVRCPERDKICEYRINASKDPRLKSISEEYSLAIAWFLRRGLDVSQK